MDPFDFDLPLHGCDPARLCAFLKIKFDLSAVRAWSRERKSQFIKEMQAEGENPSSTMTCFPSVSSHKHVKFFSDHVIVFCLHSRAMVLVRSAGRLCVSGSVTFLPIHSSYR
jgi:hypothetical protein